jgi:hypothetical protein
MQGGLGQVNHTVKAPCSCGGQSSCLPFMLTTHGILPFFSLELKGRHRTATLSCDMSPPRPRWCTRLW